MTIEELKERSLQMLKDLEHIGGDDHVKAASLRVRRYIDLIKREGTQFKKDLLELDKK